MKNMMKEKMGNYGGKSGMKGGTHTSQSTRPPGAPSMPKGAYVPINEPKSKESLKK